jgi:hypothetical protein
VGVALLIFELLVSEGQDRSGEIASDAQTSDDARRV